MVPTILPWKNGITSVVAATVAEQFFSTMFTDKVGFTHDVIMNFHNQYLWQISVRVASFHCDAGKDFQ
jgi:hypothetical protein